ncbi:hypothetical protein [Chloracidobacterium aggregatum]|uniref:hypothetical protein n=1 Tax=Chloracidobacterium aggregatum TaxID=2851959 RepID=UPI001B8CD23B|nr:hypothetical protein [Chloracidobacterium aggregatum]QUV84718.1 hypothetical protein J8C03_00035 [Chloracidobacterium sp. 2]
MTWALKGQHLDEASLRLINAYEPGVAIMAAFTRYMVADEGEDPKAVNELLNIVMEALHQLPPSVRTGLFQDRMAWGDFVKLMLQMQAASEHLGSRTAQVGDGLYVGLGAELRGVFCLCPAEGVGRGDGAAWAGLREDFYNYANYYRYALA